MTAQGFAYEAHSTHFTRRYYFIGALVCLFGIIRMRQLYFSTHSRGTVIPPLPTPITIHHTIIPKKQRKKVFTGLKSNISKTDTKETSRLNLLVSSQEWELIQADIEAQRLLLQQKGDVCYQTSSTNTNNMITMFDELANSPTTKHLAQELWKYCALILELAPEKSTSAVAAYLDIDSPILSIFEDTFEPLKSYAVLADEMYFHGQAMHGSLLILQKTHVYVAKQMLHMIIRTGKEELILQPMFIPYTLHSLISQMPSKEWNILKQRCYFHPLEGYSSVVEGGHYVQETEVTQKNKFQCPSYNEYCCDIVKNSNLDKFGNTVMMTRQLMLPHYFLPQLSTLPRPFAMEKNGAEIVDKGIKESTLQNTLMEDLPFITTIQEDSFNISKVEVARNFFDAIWEKKCNDLLPQCSRCLRHGGGTCESCRIVCPCHCDHICKTTVPENPVTKIVRYKLPQYRRDPHRLIPRIVHQTWHEQVEGEAYPNFSRLANSWDQKGWEYKFYDGNDARDFLRMHFPIEVVEAYDVLIPGAFKSDLFRYCVLFIYGGVYADIDVLLIAKLDTAIDDNIGFMVPFDSPGGGINNQVCLWNGFIASAPGHPIIAQAIKTVVNNVQNRFTSLDIMNTYCPDPDLHLMHMYDVLFTAGPCVLGASVNQVFGRDRNTKYEAGDVYSQVNFTLDDDGSRSNAKLKVPGRTVILEQNKKDMGVHTFIFPEKNLMIAATDFPDYDDRTRLDSSSKIHYSTIRKENEVYGVTGLYSNRNIAHKRITFMNQNLDA